MRTSDMIPGLYKTPNTAIDGLPKTSARQTPLAAGAISALPRGVKTPAGGEAKLDAMAHKLVAQTFFANLLKQMRDSPFKSEVFSGGRGEKAFGPMYDAMLADRMSKGGGQKIARTIVKKYAKAADAAYQKQQKKEDGYVASYRRA